MPSQLPPDPWGICRCRPKRPPTTAPRLAAFVSRSARGIGTSPGAVQITAALWGGHYARTVPLSVEQARWLAEALDAHADALEDAQDDRTAAPADRADGVGAMRSADGEPRYFRLRRRVRPTRTVGSPDMAPQRGEARVATRTSQTNDAIPARRGSGRS